MNRTTSISSPQRFLRRVADRLTLLCSVSIPFAHATDLAPRAIGSYTASMRNWSPLAATAAGSHAYLIGAYDNSGSGSSLTSMLILEVSNPRQPSLLGTYRLPNGANHVVVQGDLAYVASTGSGEDVIVVDVADPAAPRREGGYNTSGSAYQISLVGNLAYVADGEGGLVVLDISNPASPRRVGERTTSHDATSVFVSGDKAYLAESYWLEGESRGAGALEIMDVSNPSNPTPMGYYPIESSARSVFAVGDVAYVCGDAIELLDISDPVNPLPMSTYGIGGRGFLSGDRAYLYSPYSGMHVLDVSSPASLRMLGGWQPRGGRMSWGVGVAGRFAYVGMGNGFGWSWAEPAGLAVVDLEPVANLSRVGGADTPGYASDIAVLGQRAYVADGGAGLQILDLAQPRQPVALGNYATTYPAGLVRAVGSRVYVVETVQVSGSSHAWTLHVVDVSDPSQPALLGLYQTTAWTGAQSLSPWGTSDALAISPTGDTAFLALNNDYSSGRVEVLDLRDPLAPQLAASYDAPERVHGIGLHGRLLLVCSASGLHVLDVANPEAPRLAGHHALHGWTFRVTVSGMRAYATGAGGFHVLGLNDPTHPTLLGTNADFGSNWSGLAVSGQYVYGSVAGSGVEVVDVSDPFQPRLVGANAAVLASSLITHGDHLFVAGYSEGMQVFDLVPVASDLVPALHIVRSSTSLRLSWPASAAGFALERTAALAPAPAWTPEPIAPEIIGDQQVVTLEAGAAARFFRLRKP